MIVLAVFVWFCANYQFVAATPSQVHLSYTGSNECEMMVTYVTMNDAVKSVAKLRPYQSEAQWIEFTGNKSKFVDGGSRKSVRFVHRVLMSGLQA